MPDDAAPSHDKGAVSIDDARNSARLAVSNFLAHPPKFADQPPAKPWSGHVADYQVTAARDETAGLPKDVFVDVVRPQRKEDMLPIYDVSGQLLFRDFTTRLADGSELRARTAANKLLGAPVFSVGTNAPLDVAEAVAHAKDVAQKQALTPVDLPKGIVCYSYPKLGLLCRNAAAKRSVVDLIDFSIQPVDNAPEGGGDPELLRTASLLHEIEPSMADAQLGQFEDFQKALKPANNASAPEGGDPVRQKIVDGVNCIAQETRTWCAVATAKMILDLYGFVKTQTEIATAMKTGPDGTPSEPNQLDGYKTLSNSKLVATYDEKATFAKAQSEVNAGRPLKSGISGHARAVVGWKNNPAGDDAGAWLYIFDPWQGHKVWEKWGAVEILNFIYVRRSAIS